MKHLTFTAGLFAIAAMAVSCQKEQSELHLDTLPSTAVITGTVKYVVGDYQAEAGGAIISNYQLPVAGQTVMVTIPTSGYASNAEGNQYFEAVTDDNGQYRIEIPISSSQLTASVDVIPFYTTKTLVRDNAIVDIPNALYNNTEVGENTNSINNISLEQKKIEVVNLLVKSNDELPVAFDQEVEVTGEVRVQAWIENEEAKGKDYNAYIGVPGYHNNNTYYPGESLADYPVTVTAKIVNNEDNKTLYEISVTATTNRDGKYTAKMTLPTNCYDNDITTTFTAKADASLVKDFEHWYAIKDADGDYNWDSVDVEVIYNGATSGSATLGSKHKLGVAVKIPALNIETEPADADAEIPGVNVLKDGKDDIERKDPFNWKNSLN